jgi:hypothetical protein
MVKRQDLIFKTWQVSDDDYAKQHYPKAQLSPIGGASAPWGKTGLPSGIERDNTAQRE